MKNVHLYYESLGWCAYSDCSLLFTRQLLFSWFFFYNTAIQSVNVDSWLHKPSHKICVAALARKVKESHVLHCFIVFFSVRLYAVVFVKNPFISKALFPTWSVVLRSAFWLRVSSWNTGFHCVIGSIHRCMWIFICVVLSQGKITYETYFKCKPYQVYLNPHMMSLGRVLSGR